MIVKEKNGPKKQPILADCSLIVSDHSVRLITRDNGMIFDITDVDAKINSLLAKVSFVSPFTKSVLPELS